MADNSQIEWTDATWQIITGCSIVSPGCTNCYAMKLAGGRLRNHLSRAGLTQETKAGPVWTGEVRFNGEWLDQPLKWKRPRMIFVCAHSDLFHENVPDAWLDQVFAVMALCPQHTFQVLTKRPERMRAYLADPLQVERVDATMNEIAPPHWHKREWQDFENDAGALPNVWLGTSVEDQRRADERRLPMQSLAVFGWLTWVSYEPAIGCVNWGGWEFLRWVVSGGESGHGARPSHPGWHRVVRDFCAKHEIAFHFKQVGSWAVTKVEAGGDLGGDMRADRVRFVQFDRKPDGHFRRGDVIMRRVDKKTAGRLLDGIEHNGFPTGAIE